MRHLYESALSIVIAVILVAFAPLESASRKSPWADAHRRPVQCDGCVATPTNGGGYVDGAKVFINTPGFILTGSFNRVDDGECHWSQVYSGGPFSCIPKYLCEFQGAWFASWPTTYCEKPNLVEHSGGASGTTQVIECACLGVCDGEHRQFFDGPCTTGNPTFLGDINFRGNCSTCTQVPD